MTGQLTHYTGWTQGLMIAQLLALMDTGITVIATASRWHDFMFNLLGIRRKAPRDLRPTETATATMADNPEQDLAGSAAQFLADKAAQDLTDAVYDADQTLRGVGSNYSDKPIDGVVWDVSQSEILLRRYTFSFHIY
jgi:hypothetical protein